MLGLSTIGRVVVLLGLTWLALGLAACGRTRTGDSTTPSQTAAGGSTAAAVQLGGLRDDADLDGPAVAATARVNSNGADSDSDSYSDTYYDFDDEYMLHFGRAATATEAVQLVTAVRRYYAALSSHDGAGTCRLLATAAARNVREEYGGMPGLGVAANAGCPVVLSAVLRQLHGRIGSDPAKLRVGVVRVDGTEARVLLSFDAAWPSRYTALTREHGRWKVALLTDQELP